MSGHALPSHARVRRARYLARGHDSLPAPRALALDEFDHRRGQALATVVADLDRRCGPGQPKGRSLQRPARRRPEL
jgi:hypothetical protein